MSKSVNERIVDGLLRRGYVEIDSNSRRYRAFEHPDIDYARYFVGKAGGLRKGITVTGSISCKYSKMRRELLQEGK